LVPSDFHYQSKESDKKLIIKQLVFCALLSSTSKNSQIKNSFAGLN
jgi:hypothetical protein